MTEPHQQYPPSPYGQPHPMAPREHPQGTLVLVLGIVGVVAAGICAPFAWYLGSRALKDIRRTGVHYVNEQNIVVGRVLGMVMTILALIALVFFGTLAVLLVITAAVTSR